MAKKNDREAILKIDERVFNPEVVEGLEKLMDEAANAIDFYEIFSNTIPLLYELIPRGKQNYGKVIPRAFRKKPKVYKKDPRIGEIYTEMSTDYPEVIDLIFKSSRDDKKHNRLCSYEVAHINLRTRTAGLEWKPGDYRGNYLYNIPQVLRRDTEFILKKLGFKLSGPINYPERKP